jgi:polar amino acid transport system substrate-binding protein
MVILLTASTPFAAYARTVLKIASPQFPPYVYAPDNDKITGVAAEIVADVFQAMGISYENRIFPWARALHMLTEGESHALYTMMKNKQRAAIFYYPEEHLLSSRWVFFIRRADAGTLKFDSFDDLKGKRIGLQRDVKYTEALWEFVRSENNYQLVTFDRQNLKKLVANRVDYVVCEYITGMDLAKELGIENDVVALTGNPVESTPLFIVFSPKKVDREFVDRFSDELKKFKSGAKYAEILKKYNISR